MPRKREDIFIIMHRGKGRNTRLLPGTDRAAEWIEKHKHQLNKHLGATKVLYEEYVGAFTPYVVATRENAIHILTWLPQNFVISSATTIMPKLKIKR